MIDDAEGEDAGVSLAKSGGDVAQTMSPGSLDGAGPDRKHLAGALPGTVVWTKMNPATNPGAGINISMAFDSAAGVPILFNGADRAMWTWDGSDWTKLPWPEGQPDPGDRETEIVFDAKRGRTVLYGGFDLNVTSGCQRCNDTWEWFGGSWTRRDDVGAALNPRNVHALVYDSAREVTVLTGGIYGNSFGGPDSDTWEYDGTSWVQTVAQDSGYLPARREHATSFDSERGVVVLFGGGDLTRATRYSDTWEYDGAAWVKKTPSGSVPSQRLDHAMVFDSVRKTTILYGGEAVATPTAQWEWDGTSWRNMQLGAANPGIRSDHAMVFDPVRKRVVLFGGYDGTFHNDTWEMHIRGNSCVTSDDCHTGFCVDGVCCETACDGVCEACSAAKKGSGEDGLCGPIKKGQDPDDECQAGTGNDAVCVPGTCNGAGACQVNANVICQAASCLDETTAQPAGHCSQAGICQVPSAVTCGAEETCGGGVCAGDPGSDAGVPDDGGSDAEAPGDAGSDAEAPGDAGSDAEVPDDAGDAEVPVDGGDELIPTETTLTTESPVIQEGTSASVHVTVTAPEGVPLGKVTILDAEVAVATGFLQGGEANIPVTLTGIGVHELVALYPGDATFATSISSPLTITVKPATSGYSLIGGGCSFASGGTSDGTAFLGLGIAGLAVMAARRRSSRASALETKGRAS